MNIQEFSKRAGFSTATISRAFHEPEKLRPETRDTIIQLATKLGYYPNSSGRALVRGRHDVIGLICPLEVEGSRALFLQQVLAALMDSIVASDLDLLICPVDRQNNATVEHARRTILRAACDAWILLYPRMDDELSRILGRSTKPVISFLGDSPPFENCKVVGLNQGHWIDEALQRLYDSGSRRIVFYGCRPFEPDELARVAAFQKHVNKFSFEEVKVLSSWPPNPEELRHALKNGADGIIGVDDSAALLALDVCKRARKRVPEDVRIVGIDDSPAAALSSPGLSSYRQPLDAMIQCAVELATGQRQRSRQFQATFVGRDTL